MRRTSMKSKQACGIVYSASVKRLTVVILHYGTEWSGREGGAYARISVNKLFISPIDDADATIFVLQPF